MSFTHTTQVAWGHLDANGHMANTAFLDIVVDARFGYFASQGFTPQDFAKQRIGPVVRRDEVDYFKELHLMQAITINFLVAGLSEDASRFRIVNEIFRPDGEMAARVTTLGGWFDLGARKLVVPPEKLAAAMHGLERTGEFEVLQSSVGK